MNSTETLTEFDRKHHVGQLEGSSDLRRKRDALVRQTTEFEEAERILDFLRPFRIGMTSIDDDAFKTWKKLRKDICFPTRPEGRVTANDWFSSNYPASRHLFGPAFLEEEVKDKKNEAKIVLSALNEEAIAQALSGEPSLTLQVIYHEVEGQFYFFDYRLDAFCPTSTDKLKLLLSNMFIRCSESCVLAVDRDPLFGKFRTPTVLTRIIQVAKVALSVDSDFFKRTDARRYIDGRYVEPSEKPSYQLFAERIVISASGEAQPLSAACEQYESFCRELGSEPNVSAFRRTLFEHLFATYHIKPRHDVPDGEGKHQRGYYGLKFPPPDAALKN